MQLHATHGTFEHIALHHPKTNISHGTSSWVRSPKTRCPFELQVYLWWCVGVVASPGANPAT